MKELQFIKKQVRYETLSNNSADIVAVDFNRHSLKKYTFNHIHDNYVQGNKRLSKLKFKMLID